MAGEDETLKLGDSLSTFIASDHQFSLNAMASEVGMLKLGDSLSTFIASDRQFSLNAMAGEVGMLKLGDSLSTFMWTLDLALLRGRKPEESIWSPCFSTLIPDNEKTEWRIQLYPNGINRKCRGYLSIYLHNSECNVLNCKSLLVYFSVIDQQKQESEDVPVEELSVPSTRVRGIDMFIKRDLLTAGTSYFYNNSTLVKDGKVTIRCCIKTSVVEETTKERPKSTPIPPPQSMKPNQPQPLPRTRSLGDLLEHCNEDDYDSDVSDSTIEEMDDFESLLVTGRADVTLVTSGQKFYAHKAVLATRSAVFAKHIEQDELEKRRKSVIDMGELNPEVLKKVMRFIYLGKIVNLEESAHDLLGPANKYALHELKDLCEDAMIKHLTIYNASDYLKLSFDHEASRLLEHATVFYVENREAIMDTPGFKNVAGSNNALMATLITAVAAASVKDKNKLKV